MPTFSQIYSQFNDAKSRNLISPDESLSDYAKKALEYTGDPSYQSVAEGGTVGNFVRSRSADLTNLINSGPVDEFLGQGTQWVGDRLGIDSEVSRSVGESLPRMAVDFLPMAIGGALAPVTGGASLAAAGLLGTSALSAANAYEQSGNLSDAIIGGAAPYVGGKLTEIGGRAALNLVPKSQILRNLGFTGGTKVTGQALTAAEQTALMAEQGVTQAVAKGATKSFTQLDKPLDKILNYVGGEALANVGFTGLDVLQQGSDAVFNRNYLFANLVSNVPFAAADLAGSFGNRQLDQSTINLPEAEKVFLSPGEERAVYAAAMFKDLEKSPENVNTFRKKYGLDIVDIASKSAGLRAALNEKQLGLTSNSIDFVSKWNAYLERTPVLQDAGMQPIKRSGAFGQDFVGLDAVLGKTGLPEDAKELVNEFKNKQQSLKAQYGRTVERLATPAAVMDMLPKAVMDLNLDEFLKTPIEQRDYAKALEKTFLSLDGVDLIRDIHRREAGLEALRPDLYNEYVGLVTGKSASFTPDKRIELTVAASLARGAVPKFEKTKVKVAQAREEGNTPEETVQKAVQAFEEENMVRSSTFDREVLTKLQADFAALEAKLNQAKVEGRQQDVELLQREQTVKFNEMNQAQVRQQRFTALKAAPAASPEGDIINQALVDRLNEKIAQKAKGTPAIKQFWTDARLAAAAEYLQTGDLSKMDLFKKPKSGYVIGAQDVFDIYNEFSPEGRAKSDAFDAEQQAKVDQEAARLARATKEEAKSKISPELEAKLQMKEEDDLDDFEPDGNRNAPDDTVWAKSSTDELRLIPQPEGELQRAEAFARGILAKLVPAEELPARSEELINLAKMFNNPEVAYAELGKLVKSKEAAQFARDQTIKVSVLDGLTELTPDQLDRAQVERAKAKYQTEGKFEPVVFTYDPKSGLGVMTDGNHKLQAAKELGVERIPVEIQRSYAKYSSGNYPEGFAKKIAEPGQEIKSLSELLEPKSSDQFAEKQGRIYGAASYDRMQILINSKEFQSKSPAEQLKFIWAHENSHISFRKSIEGSYGPKAKALADASLAWVNAADPQARKNVEDVIKELHLDPELAKLDGIRDVLSNPDPQEWLANVWAMYSLGALKPNNSKAAFSMLPRPIRDFFDWAISGIQNLTKGVQTWGRLSGKDYKVAKDMQNLMNTVRRSFRQAEWDAAQAEKFLDIEPSSMIERGNEFAYAQSNAGMTNRMGQVGDQPFMDNPKRFIGSVWNKVIQPLHTLGNTHKEFVEPVLAVMNSPLDVENSVADVFKVVVGELDGEAKVQITNKAFNRVQNSESLLKLANALFVRSQVNNRRMIKLKDGAGLAEEIDFEALSPELRGQFKQFTPDAQQALVTYLAQGERANILSQKKLLEEDWIHLVHDLATLITTKSSFNKADFKKAPQIAEGLMQDLKLGDTDNAISKLAALDEVDRVKMMQQAQELYGQYASLEKFYGEHPTYVSFRRFGEVKQRISKQGEEDDVVDADTELELQEKLKGYLASGWTQSGPRITKKEGKTQSYQINSGLLEIMTQREKMFKNMIESSGTISPADKAMILNQPSSSDAMLSEINSRELYRPTTGRKLSGDLSRYDWYEQFQQYTPAAISAAQRRALGAKVNFWMQSPELTDMKLQKDQFMALYEQSKKPDPEWARNVNKLNAVWHIGWNLPGHIAELFQPIVAMLPELQAKGESLPSALKMLQRAERDVVKMHGYRLKDKLFKPAEAKVTVDGETFEGLAAVWIKSNGTSRQTIDEAKMLNEKRGRIQKAPLSEIRDHTGLNQIRLEDSMMGRTMGKLKDAIKRPFHAYANAAMGFYSNFTQHNGVVSLITSYRKFRKDGLSHEDAMQKAELFDLTVNNSGGRLERPELYGKLGGAGPLVLGLSSYTRGRFSQLATFYRHGFDGEQFKGKLSTKEIADSKKAFQTMILAQLGAAGVLGIPFVGAGIALMEELLGEDLKGKMINALDEVTNDPALTRVFSHGMMSAMAESFGIPADLHSRFALSSFLGTNAYDGFSAKSFMGPSVAMLDSMFNMAGTIARGEGMEKALTTSGPGGVKRLTEALSEDFQRNNPEANMVSSMLGFRSSQMVKRKEWEQITRKQELESRRELEKSAMEITKQMELSPADGRKQLLIEADRLLPKGLDYQATTEQRQQNIKDLIQKVSLMEADKVGPQDPRRMVSGRVAPVASQTAQSMGVQMQNPMELARTLAQQKTRSQFGATVSQRPIRNAMLQEMQWDRNPWQF